MAYSKRVKTDPIFVANLEDFINALFNGESPCALLKSDTTKTSLIKFYAGDEYESFKDFDRSLKSHTKRANKKEKITEFIKTHHLELFPHSAYSIFLQEKNDEYKKKNSTLTPKELRAKMTTDWSSMNEKAKKPFEDTYHKKKSEFVEKVRSIDPEYVALFDKSQAPKPPPRPYTLFVTEQMKEIRAENPEVSNTDVMKLAGEKWRAMSDSDKKQYYDKCGATVPSHTETKEKKTSEKKAPAATTTPTPATPATVEKKTTDTVEKKAPVKKPAAPKGKKTTSQSESEDEDAKSVNSKGKKATVKLGAKSKHLDEVLDNSDQSDAEEE
jgi:hypothetical protein